MDDKKEKNYALIISTLALAIVLIKEFHLGTILLKLLQRLLQVVSPWRIVLFDINDSDYKTRLLHIYLLEHER